MYKQKRIGLILDSAPNNGGLFQYNLSILNATLELPNDKYKRVLFYTSREWEKYLEQVQDVKIYLKPSFAGPHLGELLNLLGISLKIIRNLFGKFHPFIKKLLFEKCDLYIFPSQNSWCNQIPAPAIGTILDLMHRTAGQFPETSYFGRYISREKKIINMCKWCKGIIVDSDYGKRQLINFYKINEKLVFDLPLIPPSYVLNFNGEIDQKFLEKYKLPQKYIFYPAQFWWHKNHTNLVKAIDLIKNEIADIQLVLVGGKKNAHKSILKLIKKLNLSENISSFEYVSNEDIIQFYLHARALVMPTFGGPTNIPPIEAFHLGCPVATSNINGLDQQVGEAALLFDPNSVEAIASVIRKLWTNDELCKELISKGREKAKLNTQTQFNKRFSSIIEHLV